MGSVHLLITRTCLAAAAAAAAVSLFGGVAVDVFLAALHLGKVKIRAGHPPVDVLDVVAGGLEVGGGVVRTGDEDLQRRSRSLLTQSLPKTFANVVSDLAQNRLTWLSVPSSVGAYWSLMLTNFCSMGSSRSRAGLISFSGSLVSTVVLAMAMYLPFAATL